MLAFVAATFAYVINPSLAGNKVYLVIAMLTIFWSLTLASFFGMKWTSRLNNTGVLLGTLLPAVTLSVLGAYWLLAGRHSAIPFSAHRLAPNLGNLNGIVFFVAVLLGYETERAHRDQERHPPRDRRRPHAGVRRVLSC